MSDVVATGVLSIQTQIDTAQLLSALNNSNASIVAAASKSATQIQSAHEKAFSNIASAGKKLSDTLNKGLTTGLEVVTSTLKTLGAVGVSAIAGITEETLRMGVELNNASAKADLFFTSFTGSAKLTTAILAELNKTADANPLFSKETILAAGQRLAAIGTPLAKIPGTLDTIAKAEAAVGGNAGNFQSVVSIIERINTTGAVSPRIFRTLADQGINATQLVAQQLGKTVDQINAQVRNHTITAQQFTTALLAGLQAQYGSINTTIGKTLPQATTIFKNSLAELGGVLTSAFVSPTGGGAAVNLFNSLADAINHLKEVAGPIQGLLQPIANDLTKIGEAVNKFVQGISSQDVAKFVNTIKDLAPVLAVVAGAFSGLASEALRTIPGIGGLIPALAPAEAAFVALALAIPQVRDQIIRIGETLATELKPVIAALIPTIKDAEKAIGDLAVPIGDVLVRTIKDVIPSLTTLINLIHEFINVIAPIANVAASFGPIKDILEIIIIKFALTKTGVLDFLGSITSKAGSAAAALRGVSTATAAPAIAATAGTAATSAAPIAAAASAGVSAGSETAVVGLSAAFKELGASVKSTVVDIATFGASSRASAAAQAESTAAIQSNVAALEAKAIAEQEAIGFVTAETEAEIANAAAQLESATATESASAISTAAKGAANGLAGAIKGLLNPVNIAIGAFLVYNKVVGDAKKKTDDLLASQTQGIGDTLAGQAQKVAIAQKDAADSADKEAKARGGILNQFKAINPLSALHQIASKASREEADKNLLSLQKQQAVTQQIVTAVKDKTGASAQDIVNISKTLPNVDIFKTAGASAQNVINAIVTAVQGGAGQINDANNSILQTAQDVQQGIEQNITAAIKPIDELLSGENAVRQAKQAETDAQFSLNQLELQRTRLLADTVSKEDEILQANFKVIDAKRSLVDLETQRAVAVHDEQERERKFAEDQAGFSDKVLQNQIDQRKAAQDLLDAQRQLSFLTRQASFGPTGLGITAGLSLDEIKRRLSAATSTLANQQTSAQQGTLARQVAEQQDAVTSAQIKQRDAQRSQNDLTVANNNAIFQNQVATAKAQEDTTKFDEDHQKAQESIATATNEQNKLLSGQIGFAKTLFDLNHQIDVATRSSAEATAARKIAEDTLAVTLANQNGSVQAMVSANATLLKDKLKQAAPGGADEVILSNYNKQLGVLNDIAAQQAAISDTNRKNAVLGDFEKEIESSKAIIANLKNTPNNIIRQSEITTLSSVITQLKPFIQNAAGNPAGLALTQANVTDLAGKAIDELIKNPTSDFHKILQDILSTIGLNIPNFAAGGVFDSETIARIGEAGREVVLPLTRQARLQDLLTDPDVLNPILAALPKISLPGSMTIGDIQPPNSLYGRGGPSNANERIDQENSEDRMARKIAKALAVEMKENQLGNIKIDAPVTVTSHRLQSEDDIAKAVVREMLRKLR